MKFALSAHIKANKDSIIILSCNYFMAPMPPEVDPQLVSHRQQHRAADTGHLTAVIRKAGVIHRSQTFSVLEYGTLSPSAHWHVYSKVVKSLQGAREDACVRAIGVSFIYQHIHQLQDATVVGRAVGPVQLGREGN